VKLLFDYGSRKSKPVVAPFQNPRLGGTFMLTSLTE
jgi:hypothetical protein